VQKELLKSCNAFLHAESDCPAPRATLSRRLLTFAQAHPPAVHGLKKRLYMDEALPLITLKKRSLLFADKATFYIVAGTLIGARLGDILFYQGWAEIARDPLIVFRIWEGGLASHGGAIGIFIALWLLSKKMSFSFLRLLDLVAAPAALGGMFIRIGNFFGQEILGTPTRLPWGVIFGHPVGREEAVPRHPVQLYEALWYGLVFIALLWYFRRHPRLKEPGRLAGALFVSVFSFRFLIEYFKVEQSRLIDAHAFLTMGQWLSLPAIAFGIFLLCRKSGVWTNTKYQK